MTSDGPVSANGWTLLYHSLFLAQLDELTGRVEVLRERKGDAYRSSSEAKKLAAIHRLTTEIIPSDPSHAQFRQGNTLGAQNRHWFRAKFFQQYRLFYRFDQSAKVIVYVWINDDDTKRAYDSKTDAYSVFRKMLASGNPPNNWQDLLAALEKDHHKQIK